MGLTRETRAEIMDLIKETVKESVSLAILDPKLMELVASKVSVTLDERLIKMESELKENISSTRIHLEDKIDNLEQYTRRSNIRVFGVPEENNENLETKLIETFKNKMNLVIKPEFIDRCHRLGKIRNDGKHRAVIVKFCSYKHRSIVIQNRRFLANTGLSVAEDLTKGRYNLYRKACVEFGTRNTWTLDGVIKVKRDGKVCAVKNMSDFERLKTEAASK